MAATRNLTFMFIHSRVKRARAWDWMCDFWLYQFRNIRFSPIDESTSPLIVLRLPLAYAFLMELSPPAPVADANKLNALRALDQFREWRSLDDQRYCLVCGKIITGRQIQIAGTHGNRELQLSCPTEQCNSIPMDWVLPTDEIVALANAAASKERNVAPPSTAPGHGAAHEPTSQLSKFAVHFKQAS